MNDCISELAEKIIRKTGIQDTKDCFIQNFICFIFSSSLQENELVPEQLHSHQDRREG